MIRQWLAGVLLWSVICTPAQAEIPTFLIATQLGLNTLSFATSVAEVSFVGRLMHQTGHLGNQTCEGSCDWAVQNIQDSSFIWFALPALSTLASGLGTTASTLALYYRYKPYTTHRAAWMFRDRDESFFWLSTAISSIVAMTALADAATTIYTLMQNWSAYPKKARSSFEWVAGLSIYPLSASVLNLAMATFYYALDTTVSHCCSKRRQYIELPEITPAT